MIIMCIYIHTYIYRERERDRERETRRSGGGGAVMSHVSLSHIAHTILSCRTYECVVSHI